MKFKISLLKEIIWWKQKLITQEKTWKGFNTFVSNRGNIIKDILVYYTNKLDEHYETLDITNVQRMYYLINKKIHICPYCNKNICSWTKPTKNFYTPTCKLKSCIDLNRKNKIESFYQENLGVSHWIQNNDLKQNARNKYKEKTGYEHNWQNPEIRKKINENRNEIEIVKKRQKTNIQKHGTNDMFSLFMIPYLKEKYGVDNAMKVDHIRKKNSLSNIENKRKKLISRIIDRNVPIILETFKSNNKYEYEWTCKECNHENHLSYTGFTYRLRSNENPCIICNPFNPDYSSIAEQEVSDFLTSIGITNERNRKNILQKYEADIWIPSHKIIIEYNGLYWHSEIHKLYKYHQVKSLWANSLGYRIIHIWEDDWQYKKEIIKNRLLSIFKPEKIYARKCIIENINNKEAKEFLEKTHLQGSTESKINIGLKYNNELVGIMTFGKGRKVTKTGDDMHELLRMSFKDNINIIGGAEKMWKYFIDNHNPIEVFTYSLIDWNNNYSNTIYNKLNFQYTGFTHPNYWYKIDNIRNHRYGFRKDILVKQGYDKSKSEKQIMQERKILRVYDCGSFRWIWKK